jgi:hypothetical protein
MGGGLRLANLYNVTVSGWFACLCADIPRNRLIKGFALPGCGAAVDDAIVGTQDAATTIDFVGRRKDPTTARLEAEDGIRMILLATLIEQRRKFLPKA